MGAAAGVAVRARNGVVSVFLASAIVASWLVVSIAQTGGFTFIVRNQSLLAYGGVTAATLARGEWWRLFTSQFLHVYFPHALLNAAAVAAIGAPIERALGAWRFALLCLCAGTAGQLTAVAVRPDVVATGASQAALGLAAAALILFPFQGRMRIAWFVPLLYVAAQVALDLMFARTVKLPHVVSAGTGAGLAMYWGYRRNP